MFEVPMTNFSDYTVSSYNTKKQISGNLKGDRNENQLNPLTTSVPHHIETSQMICRADQLNGFYVMGNIGR